MKDNRAVLFGRISQDEQSRFSLTHQENEIEKKATEDGCEIVKRFFVEEAGTNPKKRPLFREMVDFVEDNQIPFLYILDTDRLARNDEDFLLIKSLREEFLTVVFVGEGYSLGSEKEDELDRETTHDFKKLSAISEARRLRRRSKRGQEAKQDKGESMGLAPLGYRNDKEHKIMVPDETRWELVKRIFTEWLKNVYSDTQIAEIVSDLGLRTRPTKKTPVGCEISDDVVRNILRNRFYTGYVKNSGGEWIKGTHQPMISEADFEKCQSIRKHEEPNRKRVHKVSREFFPFRGLMSCGFCGSTMGFQNQYKKNGKVHTYVICAGKLDKGKDYCQQKNYRLDEVGNMFLNLVEQVSINGNERTIRGWIASEYDEDFAAIKARIKRLDDKMKKLTNDLHIIYQDRKRGKVDIEFFEKEAEEVEKEKRRIRIQMEELEIKNPNCKKDIEAFISWCKNLDGRYQKMDARSQHKLVSILGSKLVINGAGSEFIWNQPFDVLRNCGSHDRNA